jgi:hypothetical protein
MPENIQMSNLLQSFTDARKTARDICSYLLPRSIGESFRMFWTLIGRKLVQQSYRPIQIHNFLNGLPVERGIYSLSFGQHGNDIVIESYALK